MNKREELFSVFKEAIDTTPQILKTWTSLMGLELDENLTKVTEEKLGIYTAQVVCISSIINNILPEFKSLQPDMGIVLLEYKNGHVSEAYLKKYLTGMMVLLGSSIVDRDISNLCNRRMIEV